MTTLNMSSVDVLAYQQQTQIDITLVLQSMKKTQVERENDPILNSIPLFDGKHTEDCLESILKLEMRTEITYINPDNLAHVKLIVL